MSASQWRVLSLIERLENGELSVSEVAASIGRSNRQVQRIRKRVAEHGESAVVHGGRGRPSSRRISEETRARVVALAEGKYIGFNDHHLTEKLTEHEGLTLSRETVRRILRSAGKAATRTRRAPKHRSRRERKARAGELIQWDGSTHDWLEGRGPSLCLVGAVDDATGELLPGAHFARAEGTIAYLRVLRDILREKGIPLAIYADRHSSLKRNDQNWTREEELAGRQDPTHVKLALERLAITTQYAYSPQAKGRVERVWGTLQDRLVSELRLAGAKTRGEANKVLFRYRVEYNKRFAVKAASEQPAWRKAPTDPVDLRELCALQYVRKVRKNNTIQLNKQVVDIPRSSGNFAGKALIVRHLLCGRVHVFDDNGQCIAWKEGPRPSSPSSGPRTLGAYKTKQRRLRETVERQQLENEEWG